MWHMMTIAQEMLKIFIVAMGLKSIDLSLQLHLPGTDELTICTFLESCRD